MGGTTMRAGKGTVALAGAVVVLVVAMALDTKVVRIGSSADVAPGAFSATTYGRTEFPKVQAAIAARAVDAATLAKALQSDPAAAAKTYGVPTDAGPEFAVKFTGQVGKDDGGDGYDVSVPGLPAGIHVTIATGPAVIGTDLRDASGTISFGQFTNQIDYQNAGAALNNAMKKAVLAPVDVAHLSGKTVAVVGAFLLTDPATWAVTPAKLAVQ